MTIFNKKLPRFGLVIAAFGMATSPLAAQVETIDPNSAIDGDLMEQPGDQPVYAEPDAGNSYSGRISLSGRKRPPKKPLARL